jgi:hypothetical protein
MEDNCGSIVADSQKHGWFGKLMVLCMQYAYSICSTFNCTISILWFSVCYMQIANISLVMKSRAAAKQNRQWMLKPQDLVVAFKLVLLRGQRMTYQELGKQLHLSQFEAHAAVQRLLAARLVSDTEGLHPVRSVFADFVCCGAIYAYPAVRTEPTIGVPTAHGALPLRELVLFSEESTPVWPDPQGKARGIGLLPLYEKVTQAAKDDALLHELLALFDALRIGQARERALAEPLLRERLA